MTLTSCDKWKQDNCETNVDSLLNSGTLQLALSGHNGHTTFMKAACSIIGRCEDNAVAEQAIRYYNTRCQPPFNDKDLNHKITDAFKHTGGVSNTICSMPAVVSNNQPSSGSYKVKVLTHALPTNVPTGKDACIKFLKALFRSGEVFNVGEFVLKDDGKKEVVSQNNYIVDDFISLVEDNSITMDVFQHGMAISINPLFNLSSKRNKENVAAFRHMLVEMDRGTVQEQYNLIMSLGIPVTTLTHSGGAGLHALIKVDAKNALEFESCSQFLKSILTSYGEIKDLNTLDAPRYSRLAGFMRDGVEQQLFAVDINTNTTFGIWRRNYEERMVSESFPYKYHRLDYYSSKSVLEQDDTIELIKHDFMTSKTVSMLYARSGIGKSVLVLQLAMNWAIGNKAFGFEPTMPLRSLFFQWEDQDKRLKTFVSGIESGLMFSESHMARAGDNIIIPARKEFIGKTMFDVFGILRSFIILHRPHIVWLNPITAFFDGDMSSSKEVKVFRDNIDMLALEYNVHFVLVTHIPKQQKNRDTNTRFTEIDMYDAFGSSTFTNWPRSMIAIQPSNEILESDPDRHVYEINVTKGGYDLDWEDVEGQRTTFWKIGYSDKGEGIYWKDLNDLTTTTKREKNQREKEQEDARNKSQIRSLLSPNKDYGIDRLEIQAGTKISPKIIIRLMNELVEEDVVQQTKVGNKMIYWLTPEREENKNNNVDNFIS